MGAKSSCLACGQWLVYAGEEDGWVHQYDPKRMSRECPGAECGHEWTTTSFMGSLTHRCEKVEAHKVCVCGSCGTREETDNQEEGD